jgi:benzoyl-CoA reductase subunit C
MRQIPQSFHGGEMLKTKKNKNSYGERLQTLMAANLPENRSRWAIEWKKEGKKVIGLVDPYIPEEIIMAADMLPFRVTGTWEGNVLLASVYRPGNTCHYCTHVLESVLNGQLDFLDGLIATNWDDDTRRLGDVLKYIGKPSFVLLINVPHFAREGSYQYYAGSLREQIMEGLECLDSQKIANESINDAIRICNAIRDLLRKLYKMRVREVPPFRNRMPSIDHCGYNYA